MSKAAAEETKDVGFGTYKGRTIVAVSMELLRRSDDLDQIYDLEDDFIFVGRARVKKHDHEIQADGVHLVIKVGASELYRVDETEGKKLLDSKRAKALKAEKAREERERIAHEDEAGIVRLPIGAGDIGHPGELEGDDATK